MCVPVVMSNKSIPEVKLSKQCPVYSTKCNLSLQYISLPLSTNLHLISFYFIHLDPLLAFVYQTYLHKICSSFWWSEPNP